MTFFHLQFGGEGLSLRMFWWQCWSTKVGEGPDWPGTSYESWGEIPQVQNTMRLLQHFSKTFVSATSERPIWNIKFDISNTNQIQLPKYKSWLFQIPNKLQKYRNTHRNVPDCLVWARGLWMRERQMLLFLLLGIRFFIKQVPKAEGCWNSEIWAKFWNLGYFTWSALGRTDGKADAWIWSIWSKPGETLIKLFLCTKLLKTLIIKNNFGKVCNKTVNEDIYRVQVLYEVTGSGVYQDFNYDIHNGNRFNCLYLIALGFINEPPSSQILRDWLSLTKFRLRRRSCDYQGSGPFNQACVFPFRYQGNTYTECTTVQVSLHNSPKSSVLIHQYCSIANRYLPCI